MFRRSQKSEAEASLDAARESAEQHEANGGRPKGRPTPSRKEAEAAARERARAGIQKGGTRKEMRQRRAAETSKMREAMRTGDERYLPARDQGPVRRFVRDFVDSRICFAEFLFPLLIVILVLQASGNSSLMSISNALWTATILLTLVDTAWMLIRLRRALGQNFPNESTRGTTFYAVMRMMQVRFMRVPKRKVKIGGKPR